jgi:hypothetical protein
MKVASGSELTLRAVLGRGGTDGNERLTTITGVILVVLLAIIGVTILRIGQLISVHLFVGLLLVGPVALKLASTGYRFAQYYTGNPAYRRKGPPELTLRLIAPIVVVTTILVLVSGIVLMFKGAAHRDPWLLIHKASFIVWIVFTAIHVVGHLPRVVTLLRPGTKLPTIEGISPDLIAGWSSEHDDAPGLALAVPGRNGRAIALASAVVLGVALAVVLIPDFSSWTSHVGLFHHDG